MKSLPRPRRVWQGVLSVAAMAFVLSAHPDAVHAHTRTATFSRVDVQGGTVDWAVRVRLFDLLEPIGLPETAAVNTPLQRWRDSAAYLIGRLSVNADGQPCQGRALNVQVVPEASEPTAAFDLRFDCPPPAGVIRLHYGLFFDLDPLHTGFATVAVTGHAAASHVFRDGAREMAVQQPRSAWNEALVYLWLGVEHIFLGYDHLAFLAALLLGVTLARRGRAAASGDTIAPQAAGWRSALRSAVQLVTSFTVAHSITLIVAALHPTLVPTFWVEPAIALSVAYVAVENLYPRVPRRRWVLTFFFGLIHGFGFASILQEIGLPTGGFVRSLLAFNLGVELGQVAVVSLVLPLLIGAAQRNPQAFERWVLRGASVVLGVAGLVWFVARLG